MTAFVRGDNPLGLAARGTRPHHEQHCNTDHQRQAPNCRDRPEKVSDGQHYRKDSETNCGSSNLHFFFQSC